MRFLTVLALSTVALALPQMAAADPGASQTDQAATMAQAAAPAAPAQAMPAAPQQQMAQTPAPASQSNLDEIVCKSTPPPTGSRLGGGRECHTVREWNDRTRQSQSLLGASQLGGLTSATPGAGGK